MTTEIELQPPSSARLSMRALSDFVDVTGVSWERFSAVTNLRAQIQRALAGEPVPHGKTVEQMEAEYRVISEGVNMVKTAAAMIWLRFRATNPGLTFDQVLDMDPEDFKALSLQVNEIELARQKAEGEGGDPLAVSD